MLYLKLYNFLQLLGWTSLFVLGIYNSRDSLALFSNGEVAFLLRTFQHLMLMEVLHSLLRVSPSPLVPTVMQVCSRVLVVWGALELEPNTPWSASLILAWSLAEIIRYSNYLLPMLGFGVPKFLTWLRYSAFIVLYPIGVFSEIMCLVAALPVIAKCCPRVYSLAMPNEWNFAFDYYWFVKYCLGVCYLVGFPYLYMYMLSQRKRKLSKSN